MKTNSFRYLMMIMSLIILFTAGGCKAVQPAVPAGEKGTGEYRGGSMAFSYSENKWQVSQVSRANEGTLITLHNPDNEALITLVAYERISARETDLFRAILERDAELGINEEKTEQEMQSEAKVYTLSYQVDEGGKTRYTYARINRYSNAWNIAALAEYYNEQDLAGIEEVLTTLEVIKTAKAGDIPETPEAERNLGMVLDTFLYTGNGELERKVLEAYAKADLTFYPETGYDYICRTEMVSPMGNIHNVRTLEQEYYYEGDYSSYYENGVSFYAWIEADEESPRTPTEMIESRIEKDQALYLEYGGEDQNFVVLPLQKNGDAVWQVVQVDEESYSGDIETITTVYYAEAISDNELFVWELELVPNGYNTTTNQILAEVSGFYSLSIEEYGPTKEMLDGSNRPSEYADYGYEYDGEGEIVEEVEGYTYIGKTKIADTGWETEIYVPRGYYTSNWDYMVGFDLYGVDGYAYVDTDYYGSTYSEYAFSEAVGIADYHKEYDTYYQNISDVTMQAYEDSKTAVAYFTEESLDYDETSYPVWQILICQELSDDNFIIIQLELNTKYMSRETHQVLKEYGELLGIDFGFVSDAASASSAGTGGGSSEEPETTEEYSEEL